MTYLGFREAALKAVDRELPLDWAPSTQVAGRTEVCRKSAQRSPGFVKGVEELQVLPLGNPRQLVPALQAVPLVEPLAPLSRVAARADPDGVLRDVGTAARPGEHVLESQASARAAVDTGVRLLVLLHVLPDRRRPLNLSGPEFLEPVHDEAVVALALARGVGDDLGVLPVQEVTYGSDGRRGQFREG